MSFGKKICISSGRKVNSTQKYIIILVHLWVAIYLLFPTPAPRLVLHHRIPEPSQEQVCWWRYRWQSHGGQLHYRVWAEHPSTQKSCRARCRDPDPGPLLYRRTNLSYHYHRLRDQARYLYDLHCLSLTVFYRIDERMVLPCRGGVFEVDHSFCSGRREYLIRYSPSVQETFSKGLGSYPASEPATDVNGVLSEPWFLSCSSEPIGILRRLCIVGTLLVNGRD